MVAWSNKLLKRFPINHSWNILDCSTTADVMVAKTIAELDTSQNSHQKGWSVGFRKTILARTNGLFTLICTDDDDNMRLSSWVSARKFILGDVRFVYVQQGGAEDGNWWCQMSLAYFWLYQTLAQRRCTTAATHRPEIFQSSEDTLVSTFRLIPFF